MLSILGILAVGAEAADPVPAPCAVPLSKEQEIVLAKVLAEHRGQSCASLLKGAFDAFLAEQAKRQAEVKRLYRLHQDAVTTPRERTSP